MSRDQFFPNRVILFFLLLFIAMVISAPFVFLFSNWEEQTQSQIIYSIICCSFLFIVGAINRKRKNCIFGYYSKRLDFLWLALLIVGIIQLFISIPCRTLISDNTTAGSVDSNVMIFGSIIVAPILEESIFRGVLLRGLLTRNSAPVSVILSSVIFALIHVHLFQVVPAFLLGLLFGIVFVRSHSLLYTMILHFAANSILHVSMLLQLGGFYLKRNTLELSAVVLVALIIVACLSKKLDSKFQAVGNLQAQYRFS